MADLFRLFYYYKTEKELKKDNGEVAPLNIAIVFDCIMAISFSADKFH